MSVSQCNEMFLKWLCNCNNFPRSRCKCRQTWFTIMHKPKKLRQDKTIKTRKTKTKQGKGFLTETHYSQKYNYILTTQPQCSARRETTGRTYIEVSWTTKHVWSSGLEGNYSAQLHKPVPTTHRHIHSKTAISINPTTAVSLTCHCRH